MVYKDLRQFLEVLEKENELVRVERKVDPKFEVTAVLHLMDKRGGPAILFENVGE